MNRLNEFILRFDSRPSTSYPHGYWYAQSARGDYDADGATPIDALASLVKELDKARLGIDEDND